MDVQNIETRPSDLLFLDFNQDATCPHSNALPYFLNLCFFSLSNIFLSIICLTFVPVVYVWELAQGTEYIHVLRF